MKNKVLLVILTLAVLFSFHCQKDVKGFAQYVPAEAKFMIQFKSLDTLLDAVKSFVGEQGNLAKAFIGFNPLESSEIKDFGIDPDREFGLFFTHLNIGNIVKSDQPDFNMAFALPVTKNTDFIKKLEAKIGEKMADFKFAQEGDNYVIPAPGDGPRMLMKQTHGYLFIAAGKEQMPGQLLASIGQSSILDSPLYQELRQAVPDGAITLFGDFQDGEFFSSLFSQISELNKGETGPKVNLENWFKGYRGACVTIDFESPDFWVKTAALFDEDAPMNQLQQSITYDRAPLFAVPKKPALIFSFGLNFSKYMNMIFESMEDEEQMAEAKEGLAQLKEMTGLDLQEDLINNMGGNMNFGIYDLSELASMKINGLMTMSLKESEKILKSMELLKGLAVKSEKFSFSEEEIDGTQTFIFQGNGPLKMYAGIKDSIIVASNLEVYQSALAGNRDNGFLGSLKDPVLKEAFTGGDFFYLDVTQLAGGLKTAAPFLGAQNPEGPFSGWMGTVSKIMENFKYILASTHNQELLKKSNLIIATNFSEPFFEGIARMVKEQKKTPKESQETEE